MTTFVALPLSDNYLKMSDEIYKQLSAGNRSPQARSTVNAVKLLVDDMFVILVDELVEKVKMKPFSKKVIHQVGAISHKTINVLIDKVVSKLENKELLPLVQHFKQCESMHSNKRTLGFQLDDAHEAQVFSCIANLEKGEIELVRRDLISLLESITDQGIELFLHQPMSLIKLGLISRKVVDFVGATIQKTVPPAIGKIVEHMDKEELKSLEGFLLEMIITEK